MQTTSITITVTTPDYLTDAQVAYGMCMHACDVEAGLLSVSGPVLGKSVDENGGSYEMTRTGYYANGAEHTPPVPLTRFDFRPGMSTRHGVVKAVVHGEVWSVVLFHDADTGYAVQSWSGNDSEANNGRYRMSAQSAAERFNALEDEILTPLFV